MCGRSQFLGAPREYISTDGGFNWSCKHRRVRAFAACYFNLFVGLLKFANKMLPLKLLAQISVTPLTLKM